MVDQFISKDDFTYGTNEINLIISSSEALAKKAYELIGVKDPVNLFDIIGNFVEHSENFNFSIFNSTKFIKKYREEKSPDLNLYFVSKYHTDNLFKNKRSLPPISLSVDGSTVTCEKLYFLPDHILLIDEDEHLLLRIKSSLINVSSFSITFSRDPLNNYTKDLFHDSGSCDQCQQDGENKCNQRNNE